MLESKLKRPKLLLMPPMSLLRMLKLKQMHLPNRRMTLQKLLTKSRKPRRSPKTPRQRLQMQRILPRLLKARRLPKTLKSTKQRKLMSLLKVPARANPRLPMARRNQTLLLQVLKKSSRPRRKLLLSKRKLKRQ